MALFRVPPMSLGAMLVASGAAPGVAGLMLPGAAIRASMMLLRMIPRVVVRYVAMNSVSRVRMPGGMHAQSARVARKCVTNDMQVCRASCGAPDARSHLQRRGKSGRMAKARGW